MYHVVRNHRGGTFIAVFYGTHKIRKKRSNFMNLTFCLKLKMSKQKRTVHTVITKQYVPSGLHGYNFFKILQLLTDGEKLRLKDFLIKMNRPE
jgi:hypothetical protein